MLYRSFYVVPVGFASINVKFAVVTPLVGIAYLHCECVEFFPCAGLGGVAHPSECVDVLSQCCLQVGNKVEHLVLGCRREVFFDIELTYGLSEKRVGDTHGAFPSGQRLLNTRHGLG